MVAGGLGEGGKLTTTPSHTVVRRRFSDMRAAALLALALASPEAHCSSCMLVADGTHAWGGAHSDDVSSEGAAGGEKFQHFIYEFRVLQAAAGAKADDAVVDGLYVSLTFDAAVIVTHVYGGFGAKEVIDGRAPNYARVGSRNFVLRMCGDGSCEAGRRFDSHSAAAMPRMELHGTRAGLLRDGEGQASIMAVDVRLHWLPTLIDKYSEEARSMVAIT